MSAKEDSPFSKLTDGDWCHSAVGRVKEFESLRPGWDSYCAPNPNPLAIRTALTILSVLERMGYPPRRVAASAESGIVISFRKGNRYGDIECDNEGDLIAVTSNGEGEVRAEPVANDPHAIEEAVTRIRAYIEA